MKKNILMLIAVIGFIGTVFSAEIDTEIDKIKFVNHSAKNIKIGEPGNMDVSLYPNPSSGILFLRSTEVVNVLVYNVVGELVFQGEGVTEIDLSGESRGLYMVQISSKTDTVTRKITIQ